MNIDIKNLIENKLTPNDILINDLATYPEDLMEQMIYEDFCEDNFLNYFYENLQYNVVGVHFTRLFDYEIEDIKSNGLHSDDDISYRKKVQRLPNKFDKYKSKLLEFVEEPLNKRSDGDIYFDIGKIKIYYGNSVFLKNWGGETLYCYYDKFHNTDESLINLRNELRKSTIPCLVIVKVNAYQFFADFLSIENLIESIKNNTLADYGNEFNIVADEVSVITIIPVKYIKIRT